MDAHEGDTGAIGPAGEPIEVEISDLAPRRIRERLPRWVPAGVTIPPRRHSVRALTTLGPALVALVIALASFPAVRDQAALLAFGPTPAPTATLKAGSDLFYILTGAPWASITIDGRPLTRLPVIGRDLPLRLARGQHLVRWQGAPFDAWQCTISVPVTDGDSCPFDRGYTGSGPTATNLFWVLTLYPTLSELPAQQWSALVAAAQAALDLEQSSDIVRPGEWYAQWAESGGAQSATQPLRATLSFRLEVQQSPAEPVAPSCGPDFPSGCAQPGGWSCMQLCTWPEAGSPAYWSVLAPAYGSWTYDTLRGALVATDQPDGGTGVFVPLRITWDGAAWHVALAPASPSAAYTSIAYTPDPSQPTIDVPGCVTLRTSARSAAFPLAGPLPGVYASLSWRFANATPLASGCLGVATPLAGTSPPAYVLQRFGVLLAANTVAQALWPYLPTADADEQALARRLAGA